MPQNKIPSPISTIPMAEIKAAKPNGDIQENILIPPPLKFYFCSNYNSNFLEKQIFIGKICMSSIDKFLNIIC
jgi:hypothetical protein